MGGRTVMATKTTKPTKPATAQRRPTFIVVLEGEFWPLVPVEIRLRKFLKMALRAFGLKCTAIREEQPQATEPAKPVVPPGAEKFKGKG